MSNLGFWEKLKRPFFALAPMADVTDCVFRRVIAEIAKPDIFFTEFTSVDGLCHERGREKLLINLKYSELERPIVAQIFGSKPENIKKASMLCKELGFDGVDINMGCPDRLIEKQGAGAALIKNPGLAREIIEAAREGAHPLPISLKTRMGYSSLDEFEDWFGTLLDCNLAAITIHLRTRQEMSNVPAHWEMAGRLRELQIKNRLTPSRSSGTAVPTYDSNLQFSSPEARGLSAHILSFGRSDHLYPLVIANGDVEDLVDAREKAEKYNLDGIMLGRAIFGNPWLFADLARTSDSQIEHPSVALAKGGNRPDWPEVFRVMTYHAKLFEQTFITEPLSHGAKPIKNFATMRKFFGAYISGYPHAHEIKLALMSCATANEVENVLSSA